MATTTTQILFNSPALHSPKRDHLVKLCKIHSIKANGKNSELIERLKLRALELPPEAQYSPSDEDDPMDQDADADAPDIPGGMPVDADPMPVGAPAANDDYDMQDVVLTSRFSIPRPSEQWEVVMEDIVEVDETVGTASSKNSLKTVSNGEFGTHTSKCECSVTYISHGGGDTSSGVACHLPEDVACACRGSTSIGLVRWYAELFHSLALVGANHPSRASSGSVGSSHREIEQQGRRHIPSEFNLRVEGLLS